MKATKAEVLASPSGTRFTKVKCYDGDGNLCDVEYIPKDNNQDYDDDLKDSKEVADGYFTETWHITRK